MPSARPNGRREGLDALLAQVGFAGKTLDDWLRDGFSSSMRAVPSAALRLAHLGWPQRRLPSAGEPPPPDGRAERRRAAHAGEAAVLYLGDWIDRQRADQEAGVRCGRTGRGGGAREDRVDEHPRRRAAHDLFVRWKPLAEQPIGWEPDINDGVRINVRPS